MTLQEMIITINDHIFDPYTKNLYYQFYKVTNITITPSGEKAIITYGDGAIEFLYDFELKYIYNQI